MPVAPIGLVSPLRPPLNEVRICHWQNAQLPQPYSRRRARSRMRACARMRVCVRACMRARVRAYVRGVCACVRARRCGRRLGVFCSHGGGGCDGGVGLQRALLKRHWHSSWLSHRVLRGGCVTIDSRRYGIAQAKGGARLSAAGGFYYVRATVGAAAVAAAGKSGYRMPLRSMPLEPCGFMRPEHTYRPPWIFPTMHQRDSLPAAAVVSGRVSAAPGSGGRLETVVRQHLKSGLQNPPGGWSRQLRWGMA